MNRQINKEFSIDELGPYWLDERGKTYFTEEETKMLEEKVNADYEHIIKR